MSKQKSWFNGVSPMAYRSPFWLLSAVLLGILFLTGCQALNPACILSSRPVPVIASLKPSTVTFAQVQGTFVLTVNGSHFVSSSVILLNGVPLATTVVSDLVLKATITDTLIPAPGSANVAVHTPSSLSGDLGCDNGGNSAALILTVT
jgi:hypothetical protein